MDIDIDKFLNREKDVNEHVHILPHWHQDGKLQFVTFHLADSLPVSVRDDLVRHRDFWLSLHPKPWTDEESQEYLNRFANRPELWLDRGFGECILNDPLNASIVEETLMYFDGKRYLLHAYVIMANHVHVLYETLGDVRPEVIGNTWRQYSTKAINRRMNRTGRLWSRDIYDRIIRNQDHYNNVMSYIKKNIRQGGVRWMI